MYKAVIFYTNFANFCCKTWIVLIFSQIWGSATFLACSYFFRNLSLNVLISMVLIKKKSVVISFCCCIAAVRLRRCPEKCYHTRGIIWLEALYCCDYLLASILTKSDRSLDHEALYFHTDRCVETIQWGLTRSSSKCISIGLVWNVVPTVKRVYGNKYGDTSSFIKLIIYKTEKLFYHEKL